MDQLPSGDLTLPLEVLAIILGFICTYKKDGKVKHNNGANFIAAFPALKTSLQLVWRDRIIVYPLLDGTVIAKSDGDALIQRFMQNGYINDLRMYVQQHGAMALFSCIDKHAPSADVLVASLRFHSVEERAVYIEAVMFVAASTAIRDCTQDRHPSPLKSTSGEYYLEIVRAYLHPSTEIATSLKKRIDLLTTLMGIVNTGEDIVTVWRYLVQGASASCAFLLFVVACMSEIIHPKTAMTVKAWLAISCPHSFWFARIYNHTAKAFVSNVLCLSASEEHAALAGVIARTMYNTDSEYSKIPAHIDAAIPWPIANTSKVVPLSTAFTVKTFFNPLVTTIFMTLAIRSFPWDHLQRRGIHLVLKNILTRCDDKVSTNMVWSRLRMFVFIAAYIGLTDIPDRETYRHISRANSNSLVLTFIKCMFRDTIVLMCGKPDYDGPPHLNRALRLEKWVSRKGPGDFQRFSVRLEKLQQRIAACQMFIKSKELVKAAVQVLTEHVSSVAPPVPREVKKTRQLSLPQSESHPLSILKVRFSRDMHQDCQGEEYWTGTPIQIILDAVEGYQATHEHRGTKYMCAIGIAYPCFKFIHRTCWDNYVAEDEPMNMDECAAFELF